MKPSGALLGSWRRSNRNAWIRLIMWGIGLVACIAYYFSAGLGALLVGIIFLVLFVLDARRVLTDRECIFDLYTGGFVVKTQNDSELYSYRWSDIVDARWPMGDGSSTTSHMKSSGDSILGFLIGMVIEFIITIIIYAIVSGINANRAKHSLWFLTKERKIHLDGSYENATEMVKLARETAIAAWVDEMDTQLEQGKPVALDDILIITREGIQRNGETVGWGSITEVKPSVEQDKLTIVGTSADGKKQTYKYGTGLKSIAVNTVINQLRPQ